MYKCEDTTLYLYDTVKRKILYF